jgi:hypothetical protein
VQCLGSGPLLAAVLTSALLHHTTQVSGTSEQVVGAVRMITEKLRAVLGLGGAAGGSDRDRGGGMERQQPPWGDNKRQRGPEPDDRRRGAPGSLHVVAIVCTATSRWCLIRVCLMHYRPELAGVSIALCAVYGDVSLRLCWLALYLGNSCFAWH